MMLYWTAHNLNCQPASQYIGPIYRFSPPFKNMIIEVPIAHANNLLSSVNGGTCIGTAHLIFHFKQIIFEVSRLKVNNC